MEREFHRYLACGILAHGSARARCGECGHDFLIAFSCKGRAVCPSCNGRRMVATNAQPAPIAERAAEPAHRRAAYGPTVRDLLDPLGEPAAPPRIARAARDGVGVGASTCNALSSPSPTAGAARRCAPPVEAL